MNSLEVNMKTYDRVKLILEQSERARNSDKALIWEFWVQESKATKMKDYSPGVLFQHNFMQATSPESIRRCRQKIQEKHPELAPTLQGVRRKRKIKEQTKGTFAYREDIEKDVYY